MRLKNEMHQDAFIALRSGVGAQVTLNSLTLNSLRAPTGRACGAWRVAGAKDTLPAPSSVSSSAGSSISAASSTSDYVGASQQTCLPSGLQLHFAASPSMSMRSASPSALQLLCRAI